jgi:cell fate (sporulation/competence/biofilm development) regulator YmcA (YheA/YmcA/DUF963 family)
MVMTNEAHVMSSSGMKHYKSEELVLREDILAKAKEIAELLSTTDEVITFRKAEALISRNERIQKLIGAIKKKQKEIVAFEHFQNPQMVAKIEGEMRKLQDELDSIPLVRQFQQTQSDINYLLQLVVSVIKDTLAEMINVESAAAAPPERCD